MSEPAFKQKYRKPTGFYIPRNEDTEKLYELERKRNDAFEAAAKELKKVLDFKFFWQEAVPEAMLNLLEGWDRHAATLGAVAYLEKQNDRAYTEPFHQTLVITGVDLDVLDDQRKILNLLQDSNQWDNLTPGQRDAVIGIGFMLDAWSDERAGRS